MKDDWKVISVYILVVGGWFGLSILSWIYFSKTISVLFGIIGLVFAFASKVVKWFTDFAMDLVK